jgi:uncharacterized protein (DUF488 family)
MPELYTIGYGNDRNIERIQQALDEHPNTVLVDVRRFPTSQGRPCFDWDSLRQSLGRRYMYYGVIFGNGAKKGDHDPHWHLSGLWYANILDWQATPPSLESAIIEIKDHLETMKRSFQYENQVPMFFCSERKYTDCHRLSVAEFAVQYAWQGYEIVHL